MRTFQTGSIGDVVSFSLMFERPDGVTVPMDFTAASSVRLAIQDTTTGRTAVYPATVLGNVVSILTTARTFTTAGTHKWQCLTSFPSGDEMRSPVGSVLVEQSLV